MDHKLGVVGLGVMGGNLARNAERNGFPVAGYDLDAGKDAHLRRGPGAGRQVNGADSPAALMAVLEKPRRVLMMVPAGPPSTAPSRISGRTSNRATSSSTAATRGSPTPTAAARTSRAAASTSSGTGVSGGEEGALWGPCMMPGGQREACDALAPDPPGHRGEGRGRRARASTTWAARRRPLREDGAQRHRVRRHAADRRGLRPAAARARPVERRAARRLRRVEQGRAAVAT